MSACRRWAWLLYGDAPLDDRMFTRVSICAAMEECGATQSEIENLIRIWQCR